MDVKSTLVSTSLSSTRTGWLIAADPIASSLSNCSLLLFLLGLVICTSRSRTWLSGTGLDDVLAGASTSTPGPPGDSSASASSSSSCDGDISLSYGVGTGACSPLATSLDLIRLW